MKKRFAFRVPRFAFRVSRSAFRVSRFAFRVSRSLFRIADEFGTRNSNSERETRNEKRNDQHLGLNFQGHEITLSKRL